MEIERGKFTPQRRWERISFLSLAGDGLQVFWKIGEIVQWFAIICTIREIFNEYIMCVVQNILKFYQQFNETRLSWFYIKVYDVYDFAYSIIVSIIIFLQFVLWIYYTTWILFLDNTKRYLLTNNIDKIVIKASLFF